MAYHVKIDSDVNCVFVRHYNTYLFEEGIIQMEEPAAKPNYKPGMNFLRDVSQTVLPPEYCLDWFKVIASSDLPEI